MRPRYLAADGPPVPLALLAGIAVAALLGVVVGFASLRLRHDFLAVTTIGVSFLFVGFVRKQAWLGAEMGISRNPAVRPRRRGQRAAHPRLRARHHRLEPLCPAQLDGVFFRAVGDDEGAARSIGISVTAYKLAAFTLGTAIAGLAGGLYAYFTQFIVPNSFGFIVSVMLMAMVVIGGTGSTLGVVAAAIILTLLPEVFRFMNEYRLLVFGGLLVLVVRFAPGGLAGIGRAAVAKVRGPNRARQ